MERQLGTLWRAAQKWAEGGGRGRRQLPSGAASWGNSHHCPLCTHSTLTGALIHRPEGPSTFSVLLPSRAPPSGVGRAVKREASKSKRSPFAHCDLLTLLLRLSSHRSAFKGAAGLPEMSQEEEGNWLGVQGEDGGVHSLRTPCWGVLEILWTSSVPQYGQTPNNCRCHHRLCGCTRHADTPTVGHLSAEKSPLKRVFCQTCSLQEVGGAQRQAAGLQE